MHHKFSVMGRPCRRSRPLEQFDWAAGSGAPKAQIQELAHLTFVERAENVVLLGPSGVGKTHIALALADSCVPEKLSDNGVL